MNLRHLITVAPLALACLIVGCEKKQPPPPLPPPPPPPPPPTVFEMKDILADLKVDARVQTAPDVGVTDNTFVRAVAKLADAIVTGDVTKVEPMLTRRAKEALGLVKANDGWTKATRNIELIRIVYAAAPQTLSDIEREQAIATMGAEFGNGVKLRESTWSRNGYTRLEITRFEEAAREVFMKELTKLNSKAAIDAAIDGRPEFVVLMAIQDPTGSYLLGWGGVRDGDGWLFNNAATTPIEKSRASDWDGIGMFGFSIGDGEYQPPMPRGVTEKDGKDGGSPPAPGASAPGAPAPAAPSPGAPAPGKPEEPTRRNTPSGPINIPKPSGG